MRIKDKQALVDNNRVRAFAEVEEFHGHVVSVSVDELLKMMEILKALKKGGFETVRVGVEAIRAVDGAGMLCFFLTKDNKFAYILAGCVD